MIRLPKIWGLPTDISIVREKLPESDVQAIFLKAKVYGSKWEYTEIFIPQDTMFNQDFLKDKQFTILLAYMENLFNALLVDLRIDFGAEILPNHIIPKEQLQGEENGAGRTTQQTA